MDKTKIIFMGTPPFAATVLQGLIDSGAYEILAVVTQPDRKVGRKRQLQQTPVKIVALAAGLPVLQPENLVGSPELAKLMELGAGGIITAAFGQFLPVKLLESVSFAVNTHASLLPKYRGGAPIHYALMRGESETGVTLIEMVRKMDAGAMIAQRAIPIEPADNVGTLFEKLALVGRDLLLESLPSYLAGNLTPVPQEETQVSFAPNIKPEEERIDWKCSSREIFNQIRGMNPFPVAHTLWKGDRLKIYEAQQSALTGAPGVVLERTKKSLVVGAGTGSLALLVVQPAGKPKMSVVDFLNGIGRDIKEGDQLGEI